MSLLNQVARQFRGNSLRSVASGGLLLMDQNWTAGSRLPLHRHEHSWFTFLFAGDYVERLPSGDRLCRAGMAIWHPPGLVHENRFLSNGHNFNLALEADWLQRLPPDILLPAHARIWEAGAAYRLGLALYRGLNVEGGICEEAAIDLIALASTSPAIGRPQWMTRVLELMQDQFAAPLTLVGAARQAGIHPVHLSRTFHRLLDCTFREHLRLIRLHRATDLLRRSRSDIVEVAFACGFSDHAHLTRTLKRATGLTPTAYRMQAG